MLQRKSDGGASLRLRIQSVRDDLKTNKFFTQTRTPEQLEKESTALDMIMAKVTGLDTALATCSTMQRFNDTEQANIVSKVEGAKKELLAVIRDHGQSVFIGKDVVTAAMEYARSKNTAPAPTGKLTEPSKLAPRLSLKPVSVDGDSLPTSKDATPKARASAEFRPANGAAPDGVFVAVKLKPVSSLKSVVPGGLSRQSSLTEDGVPKPNSQEAALKPSGLRAAPWRTSQDTVLNPSNEEAMPKPSSLRAAPKWSSQETVVKPSKEEVMPKLTSLKAAPKWSSQETVVKPSSEEVLPRLTSLKAVLKPSVQEASPNPSNQDAVAHPSSPHAVQKLSSLEAVHKLSSPKPVLQPSSTQAEQQLSSPKAVLKPSGQEAVQEPSSGPKAELKPASQEAAPKTSNPKAAQKPTDQKVVPKVLVSHSIQEEAEDAEEVAVSGSRPNTPPAVMEHHVETSAKVPCEVGPASSSEKRKHEADKVQVPAPAAVRRQPGSPVAIRISACPSVATTSSVCSNPGTPTLGVGQGQAAPGPGDSAAVSALNSSLGQPGAGPVPLASARSPEGVSQRWSGQDSIGDHDVGLCMTLAERIAQAMPANRRLPPENDWLHTTKHQPARQSMQLPYKQSPSAAASRQPPPLSPPAAASRQLPSGVSAGGVRPAWVPLDAAAELAFGERRRTTPEQYGGAAASPYEHLLLRQSTTAWLEDAGRAPPSLAGTPQPVPRRDVMYHGLHASWAPAMLPLAPSPRRTQELPAAVAAALPAMQDLGLAGGYSNMHVSNCNNIEQYDCDYETYASHPEDLRPRRGFFARAMAAVGTVVSIAVVSVAAAFAAAALNAGLDNINENQPGQRPSAVQQDGVISAPGRHKGKDMNGKDPKHQPDIMLGRG